MPIKVSDKLLNWASDIDEGTLVQAAKTSRLPFIVGHIALMPDAHVGKGSTIGSVIPTQGAIIPAAIGVDIGCTDKDTEFLSPNGWIKISEYSGEQVLGYDPEGDTAQFVQPLNYIVKNCDEFYHLKSSKGLNQQITEDHTVLFYKGVKKRGFQKSVWTAKELVDKHESLNKGVQGGFKTTFGYSGQGIDLSDDEIRIQIMIAADGRLKEQKTVANKVEMHFKKERKVARCEMLLTHVGINFSKYQGKDGSTYFAFIPPMWTKDLSFLYLASQDQLKIVIEECLLWDGTTSTIDGVTRSAFSSTNKANADVIQFSFLASGIRAGIYSHQDKRNNKWAICYFVIPTKNEMVGIPPGSIEKVPSLDGYAYCFTMPTGFWVMRRGNNVAITGNCGVAAVKTSIIASDLPDDLTALLSRIDEVVPAGMGKGQAVQTSTDNFLPNWLTVKQEQTAISQYGTLGSGNHFIEVCLDEVDAVWVMLHSGSRGIGNQLATQHIECAKGLMKRYFIELEDLDLAYFVQGTPEFEAYMKAMFWAQDYALGNRETMMNAVLKELFAIVPGSETQRINVHHNYTQQEHHHGRNLWITRKGAIKAASGDFGVIPGSMGTKSYIVQGRGNPASFNSCSHGAGRRLSRTAAKKQYSAADLAEQMRGKTWLSDRAEGLIDEIPSSYKDIDVVMSDQQDLVKVVHTLRQVLNFKGC